MYVIESLFDAISANFIQVLVPLIFLTLWWTFMSRARLVEDVPTSKIRSAAQGYVEIVGTAEVNPLIGSQAGPVSSMPCVWYQLEEKGHQNSLLAAGRSRVSMAGVPFIINDGTGSCYVDPKGANLTLAKTRRSGNKKESRIEEGDLVYVIGRFSTVSRASLHASDIREKVAGDPVNIITYSDNDRQPFLIATRPPRRLARYYRLGSIAALALFFVSLVMSVRDLLHF